MMKPRKPRRWIEQIRTKCKDEFHERLLEQHGLELYIVEGMVAREAPPPEHPDARVARMLTGLARSKPQQTWGLEKRFGLTADREVSEDLIAEINKKTPR